MLLCPNCEKPLGSEHDDRACARRMSRRFFFGIAVAPLAAAVAGRLPAAPLNPVDVIAQNVKRYGYDIVTYSFDIVTYSFDAIRGYYAWSVTRAHVEPTPGPSYSRSHPQLVCSSKLRMNATNCREPGPVSRTGPREDSICPL